MDQKTEVTIIQNAKYYYMIKFTDDEGNEVIGYNAKRNVEIIPNEDTENVGEGARGKSD